MKKIENVAYGGIIRNSLFEASKNGGEAYSYDDIILSTNELIFTHDYGDNTCPPINVSEIYESAKA